MGERGSRRVVITGIGLVTPLGIGVEENWTSLIEGKSGIGPITRFDTSGFATRIAGEVKNFHPEEFISKKELRKMDPFLQLGLGAAHYAFDDAKLELNSETENRAGVILGCGLGGSPQSRNITRFCSILAPRRSALFSSPCCSATWPLALSLFIIGPRVPISPFRRPARPAPMPSARHST